MKSNQTIEITTELSLSEARKLATYYGDMAQKEHERVQTAEEKREIWECLSYCRGIILKKRRKTVSQ